MNSNFTWIYFIGLILFSCSDQDAAIIITNTPSDLPDPTYKLNLNSNSGIFTGSVTIYWNLKEENDTIIYLDQECLLFSNTFTFDGTRCYEKMEPGEFRDILFIGIVDGESIYDTIQIFTRPLYPVTNFIYYVERIPVGVDSWNEWEYFEDTNGNGIWDEEEYFEDQDTTKYHRHLTWSPTLELQENFSKYIIYRVEKENIDLLINPTQCNVCENFTLFTQSDSSFIDSSAHSIKGDDAFYYLIQVVAGNFTRNSLIYNYTKLNPHDAIALTGSSVSTDNNGYINITWDPNNGINSNYFYQYEIWRSNDETLTDTLKLAIILDSSIDHYMDRSVGNGTTWYFSIAIVDISGNRKFSDFVRGWSKP